MTCCGWAPDGILADQRDLLHRRRRARGASAAALANLARTLPRFRRRACGPLRLIRARNPQVFARLLTLDLSGISGFVLPKIARGNLGAYLDCCSLGEPLTCRCC